MTCSATDHSQLWMRKQESTVLPQSTQAILQKCNHSLRGLAEITLLTLLPKDNTVTPWATAYNLEFQHVVEKHSFENNIHSRVSSTIHGQGEHKSTYDQVLPISYNQCPNQTAAEDFQDHIFQQLDTSVRQHWRRSVSRWWVIKVILQDQADSSREQQATKGT